jgi:hypothetical protein
MRLPLILRMDFAAKPYEELVMGSIYGGSCQLNQAALGGDSQLSRGNTVGHETQFGIIQKAALYADHGAATVRLFLQLVEKNKVQIDFHPHFSPVPFSQVPRPAARTSFPLGHASRNNAIQSYDPARSSLES